VLAGLADAVWTPACPICQSPLEGSEVVCRACAGDVISLPGARCVRCSDPLSSATETCPGCKALPKGIAARIIAADYASIRRPIIAFKYERNRAIGRFLAERLATALRDHPLAKTAEVVVPVPVHTRRKRERGFNQSDVLAEAAANALHLPCFPDAIERIRNTRQQTALSSASERAANVAGAFAMRKNDHIAGRRVLLVDDVITTGSTASACAEVLIAGGAVEVIAAALAHPFPVGFAGAIDTETYDI